MSKKISILVIGAGGRGTNYCRYADNFPEKARVVGVAEPLEFYRESLAKKHEIPVENVFTCWRKAAQKKRFADAVLIYTQDSMHADPAVEFAAKGYHIMLEKPMATNEADCRRIVKAVKDAGVIFAVCHVLRYTKYTRELKAILDSGTIGEIVSVQHLEPVGYWHQAHSYVRGKWRHEAESWHEKANGWPVVATWDGKAHGREPGCSDQNMLEAPPLAYAALLSGNGKWYDIAQRTIKQVPTKEMTGYGKPFSQMIMFAPELISGIYEWQLNLPKSKITQDRRGTE